MPTKKTVAKKIITTKTSRPIIATPNIVAKVVAPKQDRVSPFVASVGPNGTLNYGGDQALFAKVQELIVAVNNI